MSQLQGKELGDISDSQTSQSDISAQFDSARQQTFNWDSSASSACLTEEQLTVFKKYSDSISKGSFEINEEEGPILISALLTFLPKLSLRDRIKHVLVILYDAAQTTSGISLLKYGQENCESTTSKVLSSVLLGQDQYDLVCKHLAARVLALAIGHMERIIPEEDRTALWRWARHELFNTNDVERQQLLLRDLFLASRTEGTRKEMLSVIDGFEAVRSVISTDRPIQVQYQAILLMWLVTLTPNCVEQLGDASVRIISTVSDILLKAQKEKIIRVCIALLANLMGKQVDYKISKHNAMAAVSCNLMPFITTMSAQKPYPDDELINDVEFLSSRLADVYDHMSTFDEYEAELKSGKLKWSPVHKSERFWKENVVRFNDNQYELLKILVQYIKSPPDVQSLAIAIHDVGEYVRHYPFGKRALQDLNAKEMIVDLMQHDESKIKYEALIAIQKMMTDNWEFLGKQTRKEMDKS